MISRSIIQEMQQAGKGIEFSSQSLAEFVRVSTAVPNRQHLYFPMSLVDDKENGKRPRLGHLRLVGQSGGCRKSFGIARKGGQTFKKRIVKPQTHTGFTVLIPFHCLMPAVFGLCIGNDPESHFLARNRLLISAETCSMGLPRPGFFKASSARRSSSETCSGVRSGSYAFSARSCQSSCANSICSPSGRALAAFRISLALMMEYYSSQFFFSSP